MAFLNNEELSETVDTFERSYMNKMQLRATIIDPNVLIARVARAAGKTEGIFGPRMIRVGWDMPGELSFIVHKTYVALMSNIIPNLRAYFAKPWGPKQKPILEEDVDFVIGTSKLPSWFKKPRYPVSFPQHSIIFRTGHHFQLVSSDQPDSIAGRSGVHAFVEEMKHNKGEKLKSRIFPGLRGASGKIRMSPYYEGITGVSDTARVDLGEDNWFEDYEKNMNPDLINEIWTIAKHVNDAQVRIYQAKAEMQQTRDGSTINKLSKSIASDTRLINNWMPKLREMRHVATYYITASSFVNKDFLGAKFFKTMLETLTMDEFLTAICNIKMRQVVDMFFVGFTTAKHCFSDSYKYKSILSLNLKDSFTLTADLLKHFSPDKPLILGYDPGFFSSITVAQMDKKENTLWTIKEFFHYGKQNQGELAQQLWTFFGPYHTNKRIILFYDRAGNKRREDQEQITTDARMMKAELEKWGFKVEMKNEKQKTIFYYQHHKLLEILLGEQLKNTPRIRVCENECPNLRSSIFLSAVKKSDGKIELDKEAERKVAWQYQAGLTTQLSSSFMYMIYGLFEDFLPNEIKKKHNLPENLIN
jgi:hypothetical protein